MTTTSGDVSVITWRDAPAQRLAGAGQDLAGQLVALAGGLRNHLGRELIDPAVAAFHRSAAYSSAASSVSISRWRTSSGEVRSKPVVSGTKACEIGLAQPGLCRGRDAPAAGQRFDGLIGPIGVQARTQVADLGGAVTAAAIDLPSMTSPPPMPVPTVT